jgi:hypothetical protein
VASTGPILGSLFPPAVFTSDDVLKSKVMGAACNTVARQSIEMAQISAFFTLQSSLNLSHDFRSELTSPTSTVFRRFRDIARWKFFVSSKELSMALNSDE